MATTTLLLCSLVGAFKSQYYDASVVYDYPSLLLYSGIVHQPNTSNSCHFTFVCNTNLKCVPSFSNHITVINQISYVVACVTYLLTWLKFNVQ